jgi:hypothetical protein
METLGDALGKELIDAQKLAIIQERVQSLTTNPPDSICVNVVLNGTAALKYAICKEIIKVAANVTDKDADWYLVCSGAERELIKLTKLGVQNSKV